MPVPAQVKALLLVAHDMRRIRMRRLLFKEEKNRRCVRPRTKKGQALIEFAISAAFIIVFAFMATRIAQWFVICMIERQANYGATRVSAGSGGGTGFAGPSSTVKFIN